MRQQYIEKLLKSEEDFTIPFIFQLQQLAQFAKENPLYIKCTQARIVSYWNEYYRHLSALEDYVGD